MPSCCRTRRRSCAISDSRSAILPRCSATTWFPASVPLRSCAFSDSSSAILSRWARTTPSSDDFSLFALPSSDITGSRTQFQQCADACTSTAAWAAALPRTAFHTTSSTLLHGPAESGQTWPVWSLVEAKNRAREGESGRELGVGGELGETGRSASGKHVRQALVHLRLPRQTPIFYSWKWVQIALPSKS